jgi:hypothetical protein
LQFFAAGDAIGRPAQRYPALPDRRGEQCWYFSRNGLHRAVGMRVHGPRYKCYNIGNGPDDSLLINKKDRVALTVVRPQICGFYRGVPCCDRKRDFPLPGPGYERIIGPISCFNTKYLDIMVLVYLPDKFVDGRTGRLLKLSRET